MTSDLINEQNEQVELLPSNLPCRRFRAGAVDWRRSAAKLRAGGALLLTVWGADDRDSDGRYRVFAAFLERDGIAVLEHAMDAGANPTYPSLAEFFPAAERMERAVFDLLGIRSTHQDHRGWLRHSGWPKPVFPLRRDADSAAHYATEPEPYAFVQVEGDGVHEIPVGPVHAGIIEPGNFRFSVVGEKVLRLEERLGYTHKGVAKRFESLPLNQGHRLAARISGDSAVAYSWAYCAAFESAAQSACPQRAVRLRALALEQERIANHLGDLGALGNDAGFAFGLTHFSRLKEDLLRVNQFVFGARYLMDFLVPGGVAADLPLDAPQHLLDFYASLEEDVASLCGIYENHAGVQDRFRGTGTLTAATAQTMGALGLAARASGMRQDLRATHPWPPYGEIGIDAIVESVGDVAARVAVRFDEIFASIRFCRALIEKLPNGEIRATVPGAAPGQLALGVIEGWRGPVAIALETGPHDSIRRCHAHDPSWQNWPLLEHAILGNIVPDFPLINKSFNLSYSGHDG